MEQQAEINVLSGLKEDTKNDLNLQIKSI